jgi:polyhydroxyalkanoate synthesis regulator phasin
MINQITNIGSKFVGEAAGLVKSTIDNLVNDSKISKEQGNSIFEGFKSRLFDKSGDFETMVRDLLYKFYDKMDYATPEEVEKLRRRIAILEKLTKK